MTETGNKYIITFTDYLTKYCMTEAIPDATGKTTAQYFIKLVVLNHGAPAEFSSDQGSNYTAEMVFLKNNIQQQLNKYQKYTNSPFTIFCTSLLFFNGETRTTRINK